MSQISNALMNAHRAKMRGLEKKNRYKREREQDTLNKILFAFKTRETVASALDTVATKRLEVSPSKQFSEYLKTKDPDLYSSLISKDGILPTIYNEENYSPYGQSLGEQVFRGVTGLKELPKVREEYKGYIEDYKNAFDDMKDSDEFDKAGNLRKKVIKQLKSAGYKGNELQAKTIEVMRDEYGFKMEDSVVDPKTGKAAGRVIIKDGEIDDLITKTDWSKYSPKIDKERTAKVGDLKNQRNLINTEITDLPTEEGSVVVPFGFMGDKNWSYKRDSAGRLFAQKKGEDNWITISKNSKTHKVVTERIDRYEQPAGTKSSLENVPDQGRHMTKDKWKSMTPDQQKAWKEKYRNKAETLTKEVVPKTKEIVPEIVSEDTIVPFGHGGDQKYSYKESGGELFTKRKGKDKWFKVDKNSKAHQAVKERVDSYKKENVSKDISSLSGDESVDTAVSNVKEVDVADTNIASLSGSGAVSVPSEVKNVLPENEEIPDLYTMYQETLTEDELPGEDIITGTNDYFERTPAGAILNDKDTAKIETPVAKGKDLNILGKSMKAANAVMSAKNTYDDVKALFGDESEEKDDFHKVTDKTGAAVGLAKTGAEVGAKIASEVGSKAASETFKKIADKLGPVGTVVSVSGDVYDMFKEDSSVTAEQRTMSGVSAAASATSAALLATNFWNPIGWAAGAVSAGLSIAKAFGVGAETWQGRRNSIAQSGANFAQGLKNRDSILKDTGKSNLKQSFLYG
tara:strand:- start:49641 stop:51866 length:2226 start_codon:yes stop_codon:yes gene_type:complete